MGVTQRGNSHKQSKIQHPAFSSVKFTSPPAIPPQFAYLFCKLNQLNSQRPSEESRPPQRRPQLSCPHRHSLHRHVSSAAYRQLQYRATHTKLRVGPRQKFEGSNCCLLPDFWYLAHLAEDVGCLLRCCGTPTWSKASTHPYAVSHNASAAAHHHPPPATRPATTLHTLYPVLSQILDLDHLHHMTGRAWATASARKLLGVPSFQQVQLC